MSEWEYLIGRVKKGAISRREFMGRAVALGATTLAISGVLEGDDAYAAETPRNGGMLRLALTGASTTDSLEVGSYANSVMITVGRGLFNGLVEWGEDGKPKPELASSWEPRNGARDWIFNLRKGVKFSDGKEFAADDAIYSLNYHRGESKSGGAPALSEITDVKKLDKYQIQVSLASADADLPYSLTDYHILMVPDGFADWDNPVGTGAFRLQKFDPGVNISLTKNPDFWKDGRGHLDAAEISVVSDWTARFDALKSGQADIVNRVDPRFAGSLEKSAGLKLVRAVGGYHVVAAMQIDKAPYDNPDLRTALKFAADRDQILKVLFSGYGAIGNDHPIRPTDPFFNSELAQRKHDPDRAAFYFKRSGLTDPKIILQVPDLMLDGAVEMAQSMRASCGACGIKMDVKKEPADGFWDTVWLKGAYVASYCAGRAAATQMLSAYSANGPWNETHWRSEKFEKLLADAKSEIDEAKRKPYIWEMQRILRDEGGAIIPVFRDWLDARNDRVGGDVPTGGLDMVNGYILEKAWLKA